jgi:acyl-coenzyme A synthetase/AMP-(fatty) acid ligase
VVALRDGAAAEDRELIHFCQERITGSKVPKTIEFGARPAEGATGKIQKRQIFDTVTAHDREPVEP